MRRSILRPRAGQALDRLRDRQRSALFVDGARDAHALEDDWRENFWLGCRGQIDLERPRCVSGIGEIKVCFALHRHHVELHRPVDRNRNPAPHVVAAPDRLRGDRSAHAPIFLDDQAGLVKPGSAHGIPEALVVERRGQTNVRRRLRVEQAGRIFVEDDIGLPSDFVENAGRAAEHRQGWR